MAAVNRIAPSLTSPVGENFIRRGQATVDLERGQVVALDGDPTSPRFEAAYTLAATTEAATGLVLKNVSAGDVAEVLIMGLMGGYADLEPGTVLTVVDGELDDTPGSSRFVAYNSTTVLVGFYHGAAAGGGD